MRATAIIEGRIAQDPEVKISKAGTTYTRFSVAVTERRRDGDTWSDGDTTWFRVTAWKSLAETVADTMRKGDLVVVVGGVKMETWEGDNGARSDIVVSADSVGLVRAKNASSGGRPDREEPPF